ncbi:cysteine peptidase family C39 domain-containing protein [Mesorhizobium sp. M0187]|uniref:cysteine peptidase family C39 domain-containing protein n=1 Tax=Mesorhizobium sp. M0187 TaxID=2956908 RepID=UPI00333537DE
MMIIRQRGESDCGIACVAMLIQRYAGCPASSSYDAARAVLFGSAKGSDTGTRDLRRALAKFGIKTAGRTVGFKPISSTNMGLEFDAIVSTKVKADGWWHWLVWDGKNNVLLDPLEVPYKRPIVTHYLRIVN